MLKITTLWKQIPKEALYCRYLIGKKKKNQRETLKQENNFLLYKDRVYYACSAQLKNEASVIPGTLKTSFSSAGT
mgnify:CR=1 FL=1